MAFKVQSKIIRKTFLFKKGSEALLVKTWPHPFWLNGTFLFSGYFETGFTLQVSEGNNTVLSLSGEYDTHWLASTMVLLCLCG